MKDNRLMQLGARVVSFSISHFGEVRASLDIGEAENGRPLFRISYEKRARRITSDFGISTIYEKGISDTEHELTKQAIKDLVCYYSVELDDNAEVYFKNGRYYVGYVGTERHIREYDWIATAQLKRDLQEVINDYVKERVKHDFLDYKEPW